MNISKILVPLILALSVSQTQACDDDKPAPKIGDLQAKFGARRILKALVAKKRIDAAWADTEPSEVKAVESNGHATWQIVFKNEDAGADNRTLYIFLDDVGKYLAANYDGVDRGEKAKDDSRNEAGVKN